MYKLPPILKTFLKNCLVGEALTQNIYTSVFDVTVDAEREHFWGDS